MPKNHYLPRGDKERSLWLANFSAKLPQYATKYAIATAEVQEMQTCAANFTYWIDIKNKFEEFTKKLGKYKNELRDGITAGASASVLPAPPALGTVPAAVAPGIFSRVSALVGRIKAHKDYTEADGHDLGIVGENLNLDLINIKPDITVRLIQGGTPEIIWKKQKMDAIEIYKSTDGQQFVFLAIDTYPNYTDTQSLPEQNTSAIWYYKAIYRYHDTVVGQWSDVVKVTVTGN